MVPHNPRHPKGTLYQPPELYIMSSQRSSSSSSTLLRGAVAALSLSAVAAKPSSSRTMDLCTSYSKICDDLTSKVDCQTHYDGFPSHRVMSSIACQGITYDTYVGQCTCAALDASSEVLRELVDYSIEKGVNSYLVAGSGYEMEACGTFEKVCSTFLGGIKCPSAISINKGCSTSGDLSTYKGECLCGSVDMSYEVATVMVTNRVTPDLTPVPTTGGGSTNVCQTFSNACGDFLDDVGCSTALSTNTACSTTNTTNTFVGACKCGTLDASTAITTAITRTVTEGTTLSSSLSSSKTDASTVDYCTSYTNLCTSFLNKANCPAASQVSSNGCVGGSGTNLATFRPSCKCGTLDVSSALNNLLIESQVVEDVPELVCLGDGCSPGYLTAGTVAMIIISIIIAAVLVLTFLYIRGEPIVRRLLAHPFLRRIGSFSPFSSRPWPAKSSPLTSPQEENYPAHA